MIARIRFIHASLLRFVVIQSPPPTRACVLLTSEDPCYCKKSSDSSMSLNAIISLMSVSGISSGGYSGSGALRLRPILMRRNVQWRNSSGWCSRYGMMLVTMSLFSLVIGSDRYFSFMSMSLIVDLLRPRTLINRWLLTAKI